MPKHFVCKLHPKHWRQPLVRTHPLTVTFPNENSFLRTFQPPPIKNPLNSIWEIGSVRKTCPSTLFVNFIPSTGARLTHPLTVTFPNDKNLLQHSNVLPPIKIPIWDISSSPVPTLFVNWRHPNTSFGHHISQLQQYFQLPQYSNPVPPIRIPIWGPP